MNDGNDDVDEQVTPPTAITLDYFEKRRCRFLICAAFMWTYEGRRKCSHVADVSKHAFSREEDVCSACHMRRRVAEAGENCPPLPGGSRTISQPDTLTHSHSVQKRKHIQGDTNSPGTWPLTFLRCSEVNSLNCLNKALQLAVVNPQLKNRIFASIVSFSHIGGCGWIKMKVFIALQ